MFNVSDIGELLLDVSSTSEREWLRFCFIVAVIALVGRALGHSLKGTSKNISQICITLVVSVLVLVLSLLNFILRCVRIDPLSLTFLKDLIPWCNETKKEANKACNNRSKRSRISRFAFWRKPK